MLKASLHKDNNDYILSMLKIEHKALILKSYTFSGSKIGSDQFNILNFD